MMASGSIRLRWLRRGNRLAKVVASLKVEGKERTKHGREEYGQGQRGRRRANQSSSGFLQDGVGEYGSDAGVQHPSGPEPLREQRQSTRGTGRDPGRHPAPHVAGFGRADSETSGGLPGALPGFSERLRRLPRFFVLVPQRGLEGTRRARELAGARGPLRVLRGADLSVGDLEGR